MKRTKHGFTLVELIIVIAVIGVLAAILIPTFSNVIDKANAKSALSDARNTVTQYLTDSFDKSLPENLVVVIKKANNYYLYGYNTTGEGSIQVSSGNPYRGLDDVSALMNKYSWNAKQDEMTPPAPNTEYTDVDTYGALYLVPYTGSTPDVDVKGFHAGKAAVDMSKYPNLKDKMTEDMGDNTDVFHGILLPGQFTLDTGANGSGTGTGGSGGNGGSGGGTPETPKYTVTFDKGTLASDDNAVVPAAQELSMFIPASWASQCTYTHAEDADEWYIFDHFEKDGTKIEAATPITEATTVTVVWKHMEATKYTLTFDVGTGDSMELNGFTNGSEVRGDVASIIRAATATKAHANFTGWKLDDEHVYTSDYEGAININANWTLTAQFDDIKHTVTYKSGDGTGADIEEKLTDGSTVTLKTFASTGFTAPDGKVFYRWVVNTVEYADGATLPDAISGNITVTATYKENKFTVEYLDGGKTGATLPATKKYTVGTASVTLEPATITYYYVASYNTTLAGQNGIASNGTINTSGCKAGDTVSVTPVWTEKTVTISYVAEGATAPTGTTQNANATYTVAGEVAKSGYIFKHWTIATNNVAITGGATTVDANGTISFENPSSNTGATVTLTAVWEETYKVTASASPAGSSVITINGESVSEKSFVKDTKVTVVCTPASGYTFKSWTVNGTANASTNSTYTIDKLQADTTLIAVCEDEVQHDVWDGTTPTTQPEMAGSGTESDPYIITTPEQLAYLASQANASGTAASNFHKGKHFKLGNDIYLNQRVLKEGKWELVDDTSSLHAWTPIGKSTTYSFKGFFDGNGYTIHGLYINGTSSYSGLFGYIVETGTTYATATTNRIFNLTVDDAYVKGGDCTAGIIAHCQLKGVVSGLTYKGVVISSGTTCGGIIAKVSSMFGNIENCKTYGTITSTSAGSTTATAGTSGIGGILGCSDSAYIVKNCQNHMTIAQNVASPVATNGLSMGGICGSTNAITSIENCQNHGSVSTVKYAGGICGYSGSNAISFTNCANLASVKGSTYVGGIAGMASSSKGNKFTACANFKDITGTSTYIGGICGNTGGASSTKAAFTNCYNTGNVHTSTTSNPYMAGIGVSSTTYVTFTNCYNTGSVTYGGSSSNYMGSIYVCNYSQTLSNCHALEGSCIKTSGNVTTHDASWFTSADAVSTLNSVAVADTVSAYVDDAKGINGGRPILAWQA